MNEFIEAFTIPLVNYKGLAYTSGEADQLALFSDHLVLKFNFESKVEDEKLGIMVDEICDSSVYVKKNSIVSIEFGYSNSKDTYVTIINAANGTAALIVYPDKKFGTPINVAILKWWLND